MPIRRRLASRWSRRSGSRRERAQSAVCLCHCVARYAMRWLAGTLAMRFGVAYLRLRVRRRRPLVVIGSSSRTDGAQTHTPRLKRKTAASGPDRHHHRDAGRRCRRRGHNSRGEVSPGELIKRAQNDRATTVTLGLSYRTQPGSGGSPMRAARERTSRLANAPRPRTRLRVLLRPAGGPSSGSSGAISRLIIVTQSAATVFPRRPLARRARHTQLSCTAEPLVERQSKQHGTTSVFARVCLAPATPNCLPA